MEEYVNIAGIALGLFELLSFFTLLFSFIRLRYKFLFYGLAAMIGPILLIPVSLGLIEFINNPLIFFVLSEIWHLLFFLSSLTMLSAFKNIIARRSRVETAFLLLLFLIARLANNLIILESPELQWTIGFSAVIACHLLMVYYAYLRLSTDYKGGSMVLVFVVAMLMFRIALPQFAVDFTSTEFNLMYFIDSMLFALTAATFSLTGLEVLYQNYQSSEKSRKEAESNLQFILDSTEDAVITFDETLTINYWNKRAEAITGFTKDEVENKKTIIDFLSESDHQPAYEIIDKIAADKLSYFRQEFILTHKSRRKIPAEIVIRKAQDKNGLIITAIVRDLSLIKEVQAEKDILSRRIQHSQKLESLGVLAGGIAHDFNNLLASIMGFTSLANLASQDEDVREHLHNVLIASQRATELTAQMLTYSGKSSISSRQIQLQDVINEITQLMSTVISKKAKLQINLSNKPTWLMGDVSQLSQVVMNLITNASDSLLGDSGTISISSGIRSLSSLELKRMYFGSDLPVSDYAYLSVIDSGEGMSKQTLQSLFDPFYSTKFAGRGLGLASVSGIIRAHKAAADIVSEVNKGSCFTIYFPTIIPKLETVQAPKKRNQSNHESQVANKSSVSMGKILIVEDEISVRRFTEIVLQQAGYEVASCEDGRDGLLMAEKMAENLDLLLLDCTLPYISGPEIYNSIKDKHPSLPVLFCSGYTEDNIFQEIGRNSHVKFLQKPYKEAELSSLVGEMLRQANAAT